MPSSLSVNGNSWTFRPGWMFHLYNDAQMPSCAITCLYCLFILLASTTSHVEFNYTKKCLFWNVLALLQAKFMSYFLPTKNFIELYCTSLQSAKLKSFTNLFSYRYCSYFQSSFQVLFFRFCYILCEMQDQHCTQNFIES